jgi:hypothetical protein
MFLEVLAALPNLVPKVAATTILQCQEYGPMVLPRVEKLEDVRVHHGAHQPHLPLDVLSSNPASGHSGFIQLLDRHHSVVSPVHGAPNHAKGTSAQLDLLQKVVLLRGALRLAHDELETDKQERSTATGVKTGDEVPKVAS